MTERGRVEDPTAKKVGFLEMGPDVCGCVCVKMREVERVAVTLDCIHKLAAD